MRLLLISWALASLALQVFGQETATASIIGETNEVPAAITTGVQSIQEPAKEGEKKLEKRSHGWGWPGYGYGWHWPAWGHGGGGGWHHSGWHGHGGWGGHGGHGGWHGGWYGWPWWYYGGYGGGWHGKW